MTALNKAVKKHLEENPEDALEPKGKRGRPKSATGAASSSQAPKKESWDATLWDAKTVKTYWNSRPNAYIVNQFRLRGFENRSEWNEIKKLTNVGLVKMVMDLVVNDKW